MLGGVTRQLEQCASAEPEPLRRWAPEISWRNVALAAICLLGASVPTDYLVAYVLQADDTFRTPSVYLSIVALLLALPFLPGAGLGKRIAPILLIVGSVIVGMVSLLTLRWSGFEGGPLGRVDWPLRLAATSVLFAFAASDPRWRRRLVASYLVGWAVFVAYGLYLLLSGEFEILQHYDVGRVSLMGFNQNEQSVLVATGIVLLFDAMLVKGGLAALPFYLGALLAGGVVFASGVSRSGTLALAGGLTVAFVGWLRSGATRRPLARVKVALFLALLVGGAAVVAQRTEVAREAVAGLGVRVSESLARRELGKRDQLARQTWRLVAANPWHGVGFGRTRAHLGGDPHNGYLRIIAEGGAPAALLLLAGMLLVGAALVRQLGSRDGSGPASALVVLLIAAAAGQALTHLPLWFFLGVVVASAQARSSERR
jgi:O-antigen ligase